MAAEDVFDVCLPAAQGSPVAVGVWRKCAKLFRTLGSELYKDPGGYCIKIGLPRRLILC